MPTLSASDYTSFIKAQAASQAYRNGAVPIPIQTRDQPFLNQSTLNAQLLTSQAAYVVTPSKIVVDTIETTITAASATIITVASGLGDTILYTTSVPHGLTTSDTVTITGITGFDNGNVTNAQVLSLDLAPTTFRVSRVSAGFTEVVEQTGRIVGFVYYTTASAHNFSTNTQNISISGLSTSAFNLSLASVSKVPSSTVFAIATSATGTAVTSAAGVLTLTRYPNPNSTIIGNARIRPYDGVGYVNNPKSLVTLSQSGTLSSGKTQQLGGLPTTAPKGSGTYAPTPQLARVDTKATGAYKAVRQPV
jgi:hypothetical protein